MTKTVKKTFFDFFQKKVQKPKIFCIIDINKNDRNKKFLILKRYNKMINQDINKIQNMLSKDDTLAMVDHVQPDAANHIERKPNIETAEVLGDRGV